MVLARATTRSRDQFRDAVRPIVVVVLLYAAIRRPRDSGAERRAPEGGEVEALSVPLPIALAAGAAIGHLSGLTGVGGGIFLGPLMLLARQAPPRQVSGVAAPFILVNSLAGLAGHAASLAKLPPDFALFAVTVAARGWLGATHASEHLAATGIRRVLAAVLVIVGVRMLLT